MHPVHLLMLPIVLFSSTSAELRDLMQTCGADEDPRCRFTQQDYDYFKSPEYKDKLFTLMSSGVPHLVWTDIKKGRRFDNVSPACHDQLLSWTEKMFSGEAHALKMLDSSGKFPVASMMKTTLAMGDYDQCLSMDYAMFCSMELFPKQMDKRMWNNSLHSLDQRVMNVNTGLLQTICLPAGVCSPQEIKSLIDQVMRPYLMTTGPGFITCDSKQSTSWKTALSSLTVYQVAALVYILSMTAVISASTCTHFMSMLVQENPHSNGNRTGLANFARNISAITSLREMFHIKSSYFKEEPQRVILDMFKAISVSVTVVSHSISVIGAPIGFYLFDRTVILSEFVASPVGQQVSNEAGIGIFMVISGFTAFTIMWPMAKASKLPYAYALIDRVIKFLPAMAAVVSVELLWPLMGSGALYTKYGEFIVDHCTRNGWANLLFVNNWITTIDICAGQTFFASLVIQLFAVSLFVTKIMVRNQRLGIILCWMLIVSGLTWMSLNAYRYNLRPTMVRPFADGDEIVDHVSVVHTHFATHCSAFFAGFLTGFYIKERKTSLDISSWTKMIKWILIAVSFSNLANMMMVASMCYDLVERRFAPAFILVNRGSFMIHAVIGLFILYSVKDYSLFLRLMRVSEADDANEDKKEFSLMAAFNRLSLGMFFTNMTVIHYDLFTRRRHITYDLFPLISRSTFILLLVLFASLLFTIIFIRPVEKLFQILAQRGSVRQNKKE